MSAESLPHTAQMILGLDRGNPVFTVYADDEEQLHVYYGFELLEVVSADRQSPNFKMLVGRLYNSGTNRKVLSETFGVDPKTIRGWAAAICCSDAEEMVRQLSGRGRKLTASIEAYVRMRWPELSRGGTYGISGRLRREIQSVFKVSLSNETLRPLVGQLKRGQVTTADDLPEEPQNSFDNQEVDDKPGETVCDCSSTQPPQLSQCSAEISGPSLLESAPKNHWCDHAGLLVLAPALVAVAQAVDPPQPLFKQWLASLLLGAVNIEQTKFLNWQDMSRLLGSVVRFPHPQRQELDRIATEAHFDALARFNAQWIEANGQSDFYFDPHTKHYTGEQNVLKGWIASIRWADKAMHSDFIHTAAGEPLYFETTDNFEDLRQRFFDVVRRCRLTMQWPAQRVLTWVIDRGIFGSGVFEKVLADPATHLITWDKGFQAMSWPPVEGLSGRMVIQRARNRSTDLRSYHFEYWDRCRPGNTRLRQIVVQATNPKGRTIQVAILSDDLQREAKEIIVLIFSRWLQENDFKYLDKHFGINQITSYGIIPYEELRQSVEDRQVCSSQLKALQTQRRQIKSRQSRLLLRQAKGDHEALQCEKLIKQRESKPPLTPEDKKQLGRLRSKQTRCKNNHKKLSQQIEHFSRELARLEEQSQSVEKTQSRLEQCIDQKKVRMDPAKKRLMDHLRVIARNVFYRALASFKKAYDNYRDDHDQFRQLTQSAGVLEVTTDSIVVNIMPQVSFSPQLRRVISKVFEELNAHQLVLPDESSRKLIMRLADRSELKVTLQKQD
jgi:hypothetical protein